jgi:ribose-phosphate pyrophosphokinase
MFHETITGASMSNPNITLFHNTYTSWKFPGGEIGVKIDRTKAYDTINANLRSSDDIMMLMLLVDAMRRANIEVKGLNLLYIPYSRQDRVCNPGESLSIKVFCDMINSLNLPSVYIFDPHSDVTPALLNNCTIKGLDYLLADFPLDEYTLICPDQGGVKRIEKLKRPFIAAHKQRDPSDGKIINLTIPNARSFKPDEKLLIIVDICDGGRTFTELAKLLRGMGAQHIDLYVTYGIFSQGFDVFKGLINNICYFKDGERVCYSCDKNEFIEKI